ncbi:unnamed protein product [Protopolystoma xenopodis]|uniref:Uncharacterized protein n=1 Tax=Protopolystoma xenopodis TaxID=117903 RepID=A0A448X7R3_9PLAT|nr:unnamed protein product [Protopolystoma xenopodis]
MPTHGSFGQCHCDWSHDAFFVAQSWPCRILRLIPNPGPHQPIVSTLLMALSRQSWTVTLWRPWLALSPLRLATWCL